MEEKVDIQKYLEEKKELYDILLNYLDENELDKEYFEVLANYIKSKNYLESREEFLHIFRLITKIADNHHRCTDFFKKIEQIFDKYNIQIEQTFSNEEIFDIIKNNMKILHYFLQNEIIKLNKSICNEIIDMKNKNGSKYCHFFIKIIKDKFPNFIDLEIINSIENEILSQNPEIYDNFDAKIEKGENDAYICSLIRNDSIEEFISLVNRTNISLSNSYIKSSIFETNPFLLENDKIKLIEYAAFFGSIQIFQYLRMNNVELSPSLWFYTIHGRNAEMIHLLEENKVVPDESDNTFFLRCFNESIKCHHNDFANYFENNYLNQKDLTNKYLIYSIFYYYNYSYFPLELNSSDIFVNLCFNNYDKLVNILINKNRDNLANELILHIVLL